MMDLGWVPPVILLLSLVTVVPGWLALLWRLFVHRNDFEIAARSPSLVFVAEVMCLILVTSVLSNWLLRSMGTTLPCWVSFVVSYGALLFATTPYMIRAIRLVIAYNRKYRLKYAKFVKRKRALGFWAVISIGLTVRAGLFFGTDPAHYSSDMRECFYWDDIFVVGIGLIFGGAPVSLLVIRISRVNDAFQLREELCRTIMGCSGIAVILWVIQVLVELEVWPDTPALHVVVEVLILLLGMNAGYWGLLLPMVRAHHGGVKAWFKATVVPVEDTVAFPASNMDVLEIASNGGEMAELFGMFSRENLCMESWDFLVDVVRYERIAADLMSSPEEQFNSFLYILNQYLLPTSPDEINISSEMSKHMATFRTREAFNKLSVEERVGIFQEPLNEIARMLEQNLLCRFQRGIALDQEAQLFSVAGGDKELVAVMKAFDRSDSRPVSAWRSVSDLRPVSG